MARFVAALGIATLVWLVVPAQANHVPGAAYGGTTSAGGSVELQVSADGAQVVFFRASNVPNCSPINGFEGRRGYPIAADHTFSIPPFVTGAFPSPNAATGTLNLGGNCTALTWTATAGSRPPPPPPPTQPPAPPPPPPPSRPVPVASGPYFVGGHDRVRIVRGKPGAYDERVEARFRECSGTPPFRLFVTQRRRVGGAVVAQSNFSRPLTGPRAAPPSASGRTCRDYTVIWSLARKLYGAGWLTITLRIVDSRGADSGAPNFALRAPKP